MVGVSPSFVGFQLAFIESRELVHADWLDTTKQMSCIHRPNNWLEHKSPDATVPMLQTKYEVKTIEHNSLWLRYPLVLWFSSWHTSNHVNWFMLIAVTQINRWVVFISPTIDLRIRLRMLGFQRFIPNMKSRQLNTTRCGWGYHDGILHYVELVQARVTHER